MNLRRIFGLEPKESKPYPYKDILHMWEDDYLMVELLPLENMNFVKNETSRIDDFGKEHFDGIGYKDITIVNEKPIKTLDKQLAIADVERIFSDSELKRIDKVVMQGSGLLQNSQVPIGFGTNSYAVILEKKGSSLEHIWLTGHSESELDKRLLKLALFEFGKKFEFIGVNWFKSIYYDLRDENEVVKFIENSC